MGSGGHTVKPIGRRPRHRPPVSSWPQPPVLIAAFVPSTALCSVSFSEPEGYIDSNDFPPQPLGSFLECTYNVTVYTGYGVELQVAQSWLPLLSHLLFSNQGYFGWFYRVGPPTSACPTEAQDHGDDMLAKRPMHYPEMKSLTPCVLNTSRHHIQSICSCVHMGTQYRHPPLQHRAQK